MKKKILSIIIAALTITTIIPTPTSAKAGFYYKHGTIHNFTYSYTYENGNKISGKGFDIYTTDGNIWEMVDTDTDCHFKEHQKVRVKFYDNGTKKVTDDQIIKVTKIK